MKFSIQNLLALILAVAIGLWAIPKSIFLYQTWPIESEISDWLATQTSETPTYKSCCIISYNGSAYYVSRAQQQYDPIVDQWIYSESKQTDGALYVAPPGVWCDSVDQATRCIWETSQQIKR